MTDGLQHHITHSLTRGDDGASVRGHGPALVSRGTTVNVVGRLHLPVRHFELKAGRSCIVLGASTYDVRIFPIPKTLHACCPKISPTFHEPLCDE